MNRVVVEARKNGFPLEIADARIAATAIQYRLPIVTHNASAFRGVAGLELITIPNSS